MTREMHGPGSRTPRGRRRRSASRRRPRRKINEADLDRLARRYADGLPGDVAPATAEGADQGRRASFPSIQDVLLHILDNNAWWLESVPRNRQEAHREVKGRTPGPKIRRQVRRIERATKRLGTSRTPSRLDWSLTIRGTEGEGTPFAMKANLRTIIWHVVEEERQRRGS